MGKLSFLEKTIWSLGSHMESNRKEHKL